MNYHLEISNLFRVRGGDLVGAEALVAIMDGDHQVETLSLKGKIGPGASSFKRAYEGRPGLSAVLISGPGSIRFAEAATPAAQGLQ